MNLAKEYKNIPTNTNQFDNSTKEETIRNTFINSCSNSPTPQIKYPTTISPSKSTILTQIMADFQLCQEPWN